MFNAICLDAYGNTVTYLTQWDVNQKLIIEDNYTEYSDKTRNPIVQFCNKNSNEALGVRSVIKNGNIIADIPNTLLREPYNIIAYLFIDNSDSGKVVETIHIPLRKRVKPTDYDYVDNVDIVFVRELRDEMIDNIDISRELLVEVKSYTHGGTGIREFEETDNAQYYCTESKKSEQAASAYAVNALRSSERASVNADTAVIAAAQAVQVADEASDSAKKIAENKSEIQQIIEGSLLANSDSILDTIKEYFQRAESLYRSCKIVCDGELPHRRIRTIVEIDCRTPQQRANNYKGIEFDGATPTIRLLAD